MEFQSDRVISKNSRPWAAQAGSTDEVTQELLHFAQTRDECQFGLIFGSYALGKRGRDIDVKFFVSGDVTAQCRSAYTSLAERMNHKIGAPPLTNEDIPFEYKVVLPERLIEGALELVPFKSNGDFAIPMIDFSESFLRSELCQMRVVLSAITTPHIVLVDRRGAYEKITRKAARSLNLLISKVYGFDYRNEDEFFQCLTGEVEGRRPVEHLGYKPSPEHKQWLRDLMFWAHG
ncbi:hypothetical protein GGE07_006317 [Sinorhizobium terangae]|uniref:Nucleotidyltransferase n=1 Tax=Sinorhizobium terangae TaxID=110322 RepID=A0A6N7L822_SINTE|nr:hypothetical protein [Sinorhizobium terangae]MBB4189621.1 hypothetical protein [Sinorhizobium terangae]MQX13440.1 hypothetical protein [Sinorhizobium terangae]